MRNLLAPASHARSACTATAPAAAVACSRAVIRRRGRLPRRRSSSAGAGSGSGASDPPEPQGQQQQEQQREQLATTVQRAGVPPALLELDLQLAAGQPGAVAPATLERWETAYRRMVLDVRQLGIPAAAIPPLPPAPTAEKLRAARGQLEGMIASFLSAGL